MFYKDDTKLKLILILGFIATLIFAIDALSYPVSTQLSIVVFEVIAAVTLFYTNLKRDETIELDQSRQNKIFRKRLKKTISLSEQEFIRASFFRAEWRGK